MKPKQDPKQDPKFEALLDYLKRSRGFDFIGYKRSTLIRRVEKRMQAVNVRDFGDYEDFLEVHPEEFGQLFNTILINVTGFFRDREAWDLLAREIVPKIITSKPPQGPVRVWVAGCASGEEAYTLAIVLCEALGHDVFRDRVKIYATDVDEEALAQARQASYYAKQMEDVPPPLREKYFEAATGQFIFNADLRRSIIFGRHDLIQDAPISRLDLLVCRNTLMYLNAETQGRILARFNFAVNDSGFLFLGRAEMLLTHSNLFQPVDLKHRIFAKTANGDARARLLQARTGDLDTVNHVGRDVRLWEVSVDTAPVALIVVDANGALVHANAQARTLFGVTHLDVRRPLQDLEISYRPADLRSLIERAYAERRRVGQEGVERRVGKEEVQYFDLEVVPLYDGGTTLGVSVYFTDVTRQQRLGEALERSRQDLETTNQELQSAQEALETTNEELQSSNEELETTNEELQSTNEELETMNEELQSTNTELQTLNDELRERTGQLDKTNLLLRSVVSRTLAALVAVDQRLHILLWNSQAENLWGLRSDEVLGMPLVQLDIGLPIEPLLGPIRQCVAGGTQVHEMILEATNRRGQQIKCYIHCTPLFKDEHSEPGALVFLFDMDLLERKFRGKDLTGPEGREGHA
jgi:two-component system CheB/CheR fusion protein